MCECECDYMALPTLNLVMPHLHMPTLVESVAEDPHQYTTREERGRAVCTAVNALSLTSKAMRDADIYRRAAQLMHVPNAAQMPTTLWYQRLWLMSWCQKIRSTAAATRATIVALAKGDVAHMEEAVWIIERGADMFDVVDAALEMCSDANWRLVVRAFGGIHRMSASFLFRAHDFDGKEKHWERMGMSYSQVLNRCRGISRMRNLNRFERAFFGEDFGGMVLSVQFAAENLRGGDLGSASLLIQLRAMANNRLGLNLREATRETNDVAKVIGASFMRNDDRIPGAQFETAIEDIVELCTLPQCDKQQIFEWVLVEVGAGAPQLRAIVNACPELYDANPHSERRLAAVMVHIAQEKNREKLRLLVSALTEKDWEVPPLVWLALFEHACGLHLLRELPSATHEDMLDMLSEASEWDGENVLIVLNLFPYFFQTFIPDLESAPCKQLLPAAIAHSGFIDSFFSPERMDVRLRALAALVELHLKVGTPANPLHRKSATHAICKMYEGAVLPYLSSREKAPLITADQFKHFVAIIYNADKNQAALNLSACGANTIGRFSTCGLLSLSEIPVWQSDIRLDASRRLHELQRGRGGDSEPFSESFSASESEASEDEAEARSRLLPYQRHDLAQENRARIEYAEDIMDAMPAHTRCEDSAPLSP